MIEALAKQAFSGLSSTIVSFDKLRKHKQLLLYACISPIVSFIVLTVISQILVRMNLVNFPAWTYSLVFNFISIFVFNSVYAGLIMYNFKYADHQYPTVKQIFSMTAEKLSIIAVWSVMSAILATLISILTNYMSYRFTGIGLILSGIDAIWWVINFLIMAVIVYGTHTITQSMRWTYTTIIHKPAILIGTCGMFYAYQYILKTGSTKIVVQTPHTLISWRLISIASEQTAIVVIVLISLIGLFISGLISVIVLAAQSVLAANLYMKFTGKHVNEATQSELGRMLLHAAIAFIAFGLMVFLLTTSVVVISLKVPAIGDRIAAMFV